MSLIKPSIAENLHNTLFSLESDRPKYYTNIVRVAKSLFLSLNQEQKVQEMDLMIKRVIENPIDSDFVSVVNAYDNPRFMHSRKAFTRVGDSIDYKEITRYEIEQRLEKVKNWVFDEVTILAKEIRITSQSQMLT